MSKGSKRRPGKGYGEGYDRIWGKKEPVDEHPGWDICDEHESVFLMGDDCPDCAEESGLEATVRTFLHDVEAAGPGLELTANMWLQIAAFNRLLEKG